MSSVNLCHESSYQLGETTERVMAITIEVFFEEQMNSEIPTHCRLG